MRFLATFMVVVQLIARGATVPHSHAHSGKPEPADHASRPHMHVGGHSHSHSHAAGHKHAAHKHSHPHRDKHSIRGALLKSPPTDPSPLSSGHDDDSLYVSGDVLIVFSDRIQVPEPNDCEWSFSTDNACRTVVPLRLIECRSAGPPGEIAVTHFHLLPHLLRV